jgi:hypothetical protein
MQLRLFALLAVLALAGGLARPAGAQVGPLESLAPPSHAGSRPLDLARPQAGPVLALGATLDLGGFTYEGYLLGAGGATLRNGTVAHGFIDFYGCEDCRIEEVHVRDSHGEDGFVVGLGVGNVVRASRFTGNRVALDVFGGWGGFDDTIVDCEFEDNRLAVNLDMTSGNVVASSAFRGNRVGVLHWDGHVPRPCQRHRLRGHGGVPLRLDVCGARLRGLRCDRDVDAAGPGPAALKAEPALQPTRARTQVSSSAPSRASTTCIVPAYFESFRRRPKPASAISRASPRRSRSRLVRVSKFRGCGTQ